jgi:hypothetical protein
MYNWGSFLAKGTPIDRPVAALPCDLAHSKQSEVGKVVRDSDAAFRESYYLEVAGIPPFPWPK